MFSSKSLVSRQKILADKPKVEERINETTSRGKELRDDPYLTPEQKEQIDRESKDIEVNWNDFTNKLDDAKSRYPTNNDLFMKRITVP